MYEMEVDDTRSIKDDSYPSLITSDDVESIYYQDLTQNKPILSLIDQFIEDYALEIRNSSNIEVYVEKLLEPSQSHLQGAKYSMMSQY